MIREIIRSPQASGGDVIGLTSLLRGAMRRGKAVRDFLDEFKEYLVRVGGKVTQQRLQIARAFLDFDGHPTAEELLSASRASDPSVSQATVYRTLKLLCEAALAKEMHFGEGMARFERRQDKLEHHDHLICEACGKTIEFLSPEIERLQEELTHKHRFAPTRHRLYLYGLCPDCCGVKSLP